MRREPAHEAIAGGVIIREARLLDEGRWDEWVAMYRDDALFWVPAWLDEQQVTQDPETQVSLVYCEGRSFLEDRIMRIRSRKSVTALPLPRTVHQVSNIDVAEASEERIVAGSVFSVFVFDPRTNKVDHRFGRYQHELSRRSGEWLIARKVITLVNDYTSALIDFYCV